MTPHGLRNARTLAKRLGAGALLAAAVAGCSSADGANGTDGVLGHGIFSYLCADEGDAVCSDPAQSSTVDITVQQSDGSVMPRALALNAPFTVVYSGEVVETEDGAQFGVSVVAASSSLVETNDGKHAFVRTGTASLLARSSDGSIADFVDAKAEEVDELAVYDMDTRIEHLTLNLLEKKDLYVVPFGQSGTPLGGSLPYDWKSTSQGIVSVQEVHTDFLLPQGSQHVRLEAGVAFGQTEVTVRVHGVERVIRVTVE